MVHGGWCVGCCWALMAAMFALGVMSIGWMAFIAALIAAEKLLPWGIATNGDRPLLLVLGLWVPIARECPRPHAPRVAGGDAGHEVDGWRLDEDGSMKSEPMQGNGKDSMHDKSMNGNSGGS